VPAVSFFLLFLELTGEEVPPADILQFSPPFLWSSSIVPLARCHSMLAASLSSSIVDKYSLVLFFFMAHDRRSQSPFFPFSPTCFFTLPHPHGSTPPPLPSPHPFSTRSTEIRGVHAMLILRLGIIPIDRATQHGSFLPFALSRPSFGPVMPHPCSRVSPLFQFSWLAPIQALADVLCPPPPGLFLFLSQQIKSEPFLSFLFGNAHF